MYIYVYSRTWTQCAQSCPRRPDLGFRIEYLVFSVEGLGFRVWGFGFNVWGSEFSV